VAVAVNGEVVPKSTWELAEVAPGDAVEIVSAAFEGHSRVARQRMVYETLKAELDAGLHALAITTLTPAEDEAKA